MPWIGGSPYLASVTATSSPLREQHRLVLVVQPSGRCGIRSLDKEAGQTEATATEVETVTLPPASPAVGRFASGIQLLPDSDAAVPAIIRDATPELIEDEEHTPVRPGDRLVVAARRDRMASVIEHLAG